MPKIALAPLLIVWFGYGFASKLAAAVLFAFFPIVIATMGGLAGVPRNLDEHFRALGASQAKTFWHLRLPAALPALIDGLKIAMPLAVIGAIVGEFIGSESGLGHLIVFATSNAQTCVVVRGDPDGDRAGDAVLLGCRTGFARRVVERSDGLMALVDKLRIVQRAAATGAQVHPLHRDEAAPALISVEKVGKRFAARGGAGAFSALDDVSMQIRQGEFVSILGPSGCGKSTLLRMVAGLVPCDGGRILLGAEPISAPVPDIGVVFQTSNMLPWLTVGANIRLGAKLRNLPRAQVEAAASWLARDLGVDGVCRPVSA